jgi:hypothetical protein
VTREVLPISYRPDDLGDLKAKLDELAGLRGSRWQGRSRADIAGMLLADALDAELARNRSDDLTQISQASVIQGTPVEMKRGAS